MIAYALLSSIDRIFIAVTKIYLIHVLALRSGINTAALCQEVKSLRIDFSVLVDLSTVWILLSFLTTESLLKKLGDIISTKTIFWAQSLR